MTTSRIPAAFALALGAIAILGSSCTAILAPRDDVQRCGTADDCDPTGDNRYVPVCKFDDGNLDLDSAQVDKICVADFKPNVGCNPDSITNPEDPYKSLHDELAEATRYTSCTDNPGAIGCPANAGCADGLTANARGVCDDSDPNTPPAYFAETEELFGQDVRDQFCRSFFCDESFVCDMDSGFCVQCDPEEEPGQGGCGTLYIGGAPSCAYQDKGTVEGSACPGSDVETSDVSFGNCG